MSALCFFLAVICVILAGTGASQVVSGVEDRGAAIFATVFLSAVATVLIFAGVHL